MTRSIRHTALVVFGLFGALFLNLNWLQVIRADELSDDPRNRRQLLAEYDTQRGSIVAGRGAEQREIATSLETDDALRYLRVYPEGQRYGHVTGFYSVVFGRAQLEQTYNDFLVGSAPDQLVRSLGDLLQGRERRGDTIVTTLEPRVQDAAVAALGDLRGAAVALDPRDGAVLAMASSPSYDPNALSSHDPDAIRAAWAQLEADPGRPRLNRATSELFPPGSTFKLITAAAALEAGVSPSSTFPDPRVTDLPQTDVDIGNFGGGLCNGGRPLTLQRALEVSCNTTFSQLGLDLGAEALVRQARAFGFDAEVPFDLPVAQSRIPGDLDPPQTAQSAIGQRDVRATPLQMAMVAAGIANWGVLHEPRLVREVQDPAGRVLRQYPAQPLAAGGAPQVVSPQTAVALRDMMVGVVERGSGTAAAIPGVTVAGKTGTAQVGEGRSPTVWFVAFAPAEAPRVAVAVVVEQGGAVGDEATGGRVAAPIARVVLEAALAAVP